MTLFAVVSASGDIIGLGSCNPEDLPLQEVPEGASLVERPEEVSSPSLWRYEDGAFVAVAAPEPAAPLIRFTFNQWVDRFSLEAQVGIVSAIASDPIAKLIYDRAFSAGMSGDIDPTDARTIEGVQYLASKGYITPEAAAEALAV